MVLGLGSLQIVGRLVDEDNIEKRLCFQSPRRPWRYTYPKARPGNIVIHMNPKIRMIVVDRGKC